MTTSTLYPDINPSLLLDFANLKKLDPRITFTRASEGRYYDGKTFAKAEENLLLQSEFASNWTNSSTNTITPNNGTAPNGTNTSALISSTAVSDYIYQVPPTIIGLSYVFSFFIKNSTATVSHWHVRTSITAAFGTITWSGATLTSVTPTSGTASFINVGNDWYRVIVVYTAAETAARHRIGAGDNNSTTGDLYVWGAQLEQRSAATAYTPTTTQPITNYVPQLLTAANGVARFDHDPVTCESLGLLIEEQRTNLLTYSEDFASAAWVKTNTSIESDVVIAPDGSLTSDKIIESAVNSTHELRRNTNAAVSSLTTYTQSIYVKAAERNLGALQMIGNSGDSVINFDLVNGTVAVAGVSGGWSNASATIKPVGNGWFLVTHTATTNSGITGLNYRIFIRDASGNTSYLGDGYSGIYIWGAQLEEGDFPTSYIKTEASQVTRSADSASMTGTNFSSWYRQDEGTLLFSARGYSTYSDTTMLCLDDETTTQENQIDIRLLSGTSYAWRIRSLGTSQAQIDPGSFTIETLNKLAGTYAVNNFAASINNSSVGTDTTGNIPASVLTRLRFNSRGAETTRGLTYINKLAYYTKRLTNAQLQALTR